MIQQILCFLGLHRWVEVRVGKFEIAPGTFTQGGLYENTEAIRMDIWFCQCRCRTRRIKAVEPKEPHESP